MSAVPASMEALWHDIECGGYAADLELWAELAAAASGPVLELGAGTGRVALDLARRGVEIVALDASRPLLTELEARAGADGLEVETICADARALPLDRRFGAILAPMQFMHLMDGAERRKALLAAARSTLMPGGAFAAAILLEAPQASAARTSLPPLPDVRELDGWVYSSLPTEIVAVDGGIELRRLRQIVSPAGELTETDDSIRLDLLGPDEFEREAVAAGLELRERIEIAPTDDHVGSYVCVAEAPR